MSVLARTRPLEFLVIVLNIVDVGLAIRILVELEFLRVPVDQIVVKIFFPVTLTLVRHLALTLLRTLEYLVPVPIVFSVLILPPDSIRPIVVGKAKLWMVVHLRDIVVGGPRSETFNDILHLDLVLVVHEIGSVPTADISGVEARYVGKVDTACVFRARKFLSFDPKTVFWLTILAGGAS